MKSCEQKKDSFGCIKRKKYLYNWVTNSLSIKTLLPQIRYKSMTYY
jgi:hypothetical protein